MDKIIPPKLKSGDTVRVIAPSSSLAIIRQEGREMATARLQAMGLQVTFGRHVEEINEFGSSSIASRIEDLHDAFMDPQVDAILTVIGGYNCNQLLRHIDWELIKANPKIFCGYSDITALNNSILAKTGLVTYSGPHYSSFAQKLYFEYTHAAFHQAVWTDDAFMVTPSREWSDDHWYKEQDNRQLMPNEGYWVICEGEAQGTLIGGNLCTLNLLHGTEYMPELADSLLFIEDDYESSPHTFDRDLQSLIHLPGFEGVRGIVIGRFQKASTMSEDLLRQIIKSKQELARIPVVANVDFGHTSPMFTFPVGGHAHVHAGREGTIVIRSSKWN